MQLPPVPPEFGYTSTDVEVLDRLDSSGPKRLRDRRKQGSGQDHEYVSLSARDQGWDIHLRSFPYPYARSELVWCIGPEMGRIDSDNFHRELCAGISVKYALRLAVLAPMASVEMAFQVPLRLREPSLDEEQEPPRSSDRLLDLRQEDQALQNLRKTFQETYRAVGKG